MIAYLTLIDQFVFNFYRFLQTAVVIKVCPAKTLKGFLLVILPKEPFSFLF